jgi:hypothetical protein
MNVQRVLVCLLLFLGPCVYAAPLLTITVDELGNGSISTGGGPPTPLPFGLAVDPFSGITTLMYTLPFPVTIGDVTLVKIGGEGDSDRLRFESGTSLFFFSLIDDGEPPGLADTVPALPLPIQANNFLTTEIGPEGNDGLFGYTPTGVQPGGGPPVQYNFISDVPEPSSLALGSLGLALTLLWRWRGSYKPTA